jgi:hypothetical protein
MFNKSKLFISSLIHLLKFHKIEWEIYHNIFPQMRNEKDFGYSFHSSNELDELLKIEEEKARKLMSRIALEGKKMPKAYGSAFRHIMYRELNARLSAYDNLISQRIYPTTIDPRYVATHT